MLVTDEVRAALGELFSCPVCRLPCYLVLDENVAGAVLGFKVAHHTIDLLVRDGSSNTYSAECPLGGQKVTVSR